MVEAADVLHNVLQAAPGPLYFMLGLPIMAMLQFAQHQVIGDHETSEPTAETHSSAASEILAHLRGCNGMWEIPVAHKVARAAAMVGDQGSAVKCC